MRPLAVAGNVNVDLIVGPVTPWPQTGTEIIVDHDELRVGGSAGNTALAWKALDVEFQIAANVGADLFGQWLRDSFGARAAPWPQTGCSTVSIGITHPSGDRTFVSTKGHVPQLDWPSVRSMLDAQALSGGILLLCGAFLTDALTPSYPAIFEWAKTHGIDVALDTGWPLDGFTPANRELVLSWLPHCRHVLLNEIEATALAEVDAPQDAAARLSAMLPEGGVLVAKLGPRGAALHTKDGRTAAVSAPEVRVVDTIGAGDVFNAGYLMQVALGRDLETALAAGVSLASTAVSTLPRRYAIDAALTAVR